MKEHFEKLKKIYADYKTAVDALAPAYVKDAAPDASYNDTIQAERAQARNEKFNAEIDRLAAKAEADATTEIEKLRAAVHSYIVNSTDPATVQTLQALLSAGVELSSAEIDSFAQKGGYAVLRMLERHSGGHVQAPSLEQFNQDVKDVILHVQGLKYYRGELAAIGTGGLFGQSAEMSNIVVGGWFNTFPAELDKMAERWAVLEG